MQYINTTFAYGNGPYCRCVEWAIEVNTIRERRGKSRLPIVVPLVYPGRQEKILKEEITSHYGSNFIALHPDEILFDRIQGNLLSQLMFNRKDYVDNLRIFSKKYRTIENGIRKHLETKTKLETIDFQIIDMDLRDCAFQLGLNNRIQTGLPNQFYTAGGAGPFDELLERAINNPEISINKKTIRSVFPIARRLMEEQKIVFSNDPGVFSYDDNRQLRDVEKLTPPFVHLPKPDTTNLPEKGIYLLMTGIDGIRESGIYDAVQELGMQIYAPEFSIKGLPEKIRNKIIVLSPSQMNNPNILAQYARAGWSCVWLSHLLKKGFITPPYQKNDDPEMFFNERGIIKLGLGVVIRDNPRSALEKSLELSHNIGQVNERLEKKYGTLDGIKYAAEVVVDYLEK